MSKSKSAHDIILASIKAEDEGVTVNWKQTLLQYHDAAMQEITRLTKALEQTQDNLDLVTTSHEPPSSPT
jgi:hypothetical protein